MRNAWKWLAQQQAASEGVLSLRANIAVAYACEREPCARRGARSLGTHGELSHQVQENPRRGAGDPDGEDTLSINQVQEDQGGGPLPRQQEQDCQDRSQPRHQIGKRAR